MPMAASCIWSRTARLPEGGPVPRHHQVYYLLAPATERILYIGRTCNLPERLRHFGRRTGLSFTVGISQRFTDLGKASEAELLAIDRHGPPLNRQRISSPGCFGMNFKLSQETKARMSEASAGRPKSDAHRQSMCKPKSPEHAANIGKARLGQRHSPEQRALSASYGMLGKKLSPEAIARRTATRKANRLSKEAQN